MMYVSCWFQITPDPWICCQHEIDKSSHWWWNLIIPWEFSMREISLVLWIRFFFIKWKKNLSVLFHWIFLWTNKIKFSRRLFKNVKDHFGGKRVEKFLQLKSKKQQQNGMFLAKYGAVSILFLGFKTKYF